MKTTYTHPGAGIWTIEPPNNLSGWRFFDSSETAHAHLAVRFDGIETPACRARMDDTPVGPREYDMIEGQSAGTDYCANCQRALARHAADTLR